MVLLDDTPDVLGELAALWSAVAFWGLITTLWAVRDTWLEWRANERRQREGIRKRVLASIATGNLRREFVRLGECVTFLYIGVSILLGTNTPFVSRVLIVINLTMLVGNVVLDRLERRTTARLQRQETLVLADASPPSVTLQAGESVTIQAEEPD